MKIGIIGVGFVGGATDYVLKKVHEIYKYDKYKKPYNSEKCFEDLAINSECIFICVPTPMQPNGAIDYSNIDGSINQLLEKIEKVGRKPEELLVIIRSTAVSGTTDKLAKKYPFKFAFNPEFLREQHAIEDMKNTDRIVIGASEPESYEKIIQIYKPVFPNAKYILANRKEAEMIKYTANVFLASQIAIANEIWKICEATEIDYDKVKEAVLFDIRIGKNINVPGHDGDFGFGGKCFPKDLNALIYLAREHNYRPYLLEEVWRLNERVRKNKDWLEIRGATSKNNFKESVVENSLEGEKAKDSQIKGRTSIKLDI